MLSVMLAAVMSFTFPAVGTQVLDNCEDGLSQPCYTYDEGRWMVVSRFDPYTAKRVSLCGGRKIVPPCLKSERANGTRIYVWKGKKA